MLVYLSSLYVLTFGHFSHLFAHYSTVCFDCSCLDSKLQDGIICQNYTGNMANIWSVEFLRENEMR